MRSGKDSHAFAEALGSVNGRLEGIASGLSFLYGWKKATSRSEFVATANGNPSLITAVESLIAAAPDIDDWIFTAFKPGGDPTGAQLKIADLVLTAADITFQAFALRDIGLGITLYPAGMTEEKRDLYQHAAIALMDHTIGEYDGMTLIASLRVDPIADAVAEEPRKPLTELSAFLHAFRAAQD